MVLGWVAFGPAWFRRADALAVLYRLFGRVAVLQVERTDDAGLQGAVLAFAPTLVPIAVAYELAHGYP